MSPVTLSVDPGKRVCGCALWHGQQLLRATCVKSGDDGEGPSTAAAMALAVFCWARGKCLPSGELVTVDQLVLEYPQTYGGRASRGDANDLIVVAAVDGALAALYSSSAIKHYVPHDWKGSIEKPETTKEEYPIKNMVEARLLPVELAGVDWTKNVKHSWDVADGIGVGLKALGRFERKRVYAVE